MIIGISITVQAAFRQVNPNTLLESSHEKPKIAYQCFLFRSHSQKLVFYFFCSNNFTVCGLFRIDTESSCTYFIQPVFFASGRRAYSKGTSR